MSSATAFAYKFGCFSLLPADKQLIYDGKPVSLAPKAFDTLLLLVQNHGHLLEKDAFLKQVWPDSFVEEVALAHSISQVRKVLRSAAKDADFRAFGSDFPQHARLAQRSRSSEEPVVERADAFGDGAIEAANALNRLEIHDT